MVSLSGNTASEHPASQDLADWVGEDGYYQPYDFWLSLCGLYDLYAIALDRLGDLRGKRILDCGCGVGHTSVMLAKRGALVTGFDTSESDLAQARRLAEANGVDIQFLTMPFEHLDFADQSFDLAFGSCVLHHVDLKRSSEELHRVLRPGGKAVFIENSANNPILMFARNRVVGSYGIPKYGDDDQEHPLTDKDLDLIRTHFVGKTTIHHPDFLFFRLIDFYVLQKRVALLTRLLGLLDKSLGKVRPLRRFGYFQVLEMER